MARRRLESLSGHIEPSTTISRCLISHLIFDFNNYNEKSPQEDVEISIGTLFDIRAGKLKCRSNERINFTDLHQELDCFSKHSCTILLDISIQGGRNIVELIKCTNSNNNLQVLFCTSPAFYTLHRPDDIPHLIKAELLVGFQDDDNIYYKASAIACDIYLSGCLKLTASEILQLQQCGNVHSLGTLAPIFINIGHTLQLDYQCLYEVVQILEKVNTVLDKIVFTNIILTSTTVPIIVSILEIYKCSFCINTFGTSLIYVNENGTCYPSDEETANHLQRIYLLFPNNVFISPHIQNKISLRKYGGPGYSWLEEGIIPRLQAMGFDSEAIEKLVVTNLRELLSWRTDLETVPVPENTTLLCYICSASFKPGDHYEKFHFVYCSSKCLGIHRRDNWVVLNNRK